MVIEVHARVAGIPDQQIIKFLRCPSNEIVDFALSIVNLDKRELSVINLCGKKAYTQEEAAEHLDRSVDAVQKWWRSGMKKIKAEWSARWWITKLMSDL